ncbi:OprO/OprP family phosphate-selective porin [Phenylobacterium sp.]|uniref:OprO/OprP family phosphate-selective porin n=1 Tax=Phenylobacterium sp. TaxID=1871053 RepID=UPI002FCBE825
MNRLMAAIGGAAAALLASPAAAQSPAELAGMVRRQQEVIEALSRRLELLEGRLASTAPAPAPAPAPAVAVASPVQASPADPPPAYTAKLRGRIHADAWRVDDGASGTELRRARIGVEGRVAAMPYVIEADFAGNTVSLQDAFFAIPLGARAQVRLGYHKVPFGLDDQTSDNYNLFLEHPAGIDPFVPGRGVGASVWAKGARWFATAGLFGEGENDARDGLTDESLTLGGRVAWAPVLEQDRYLHLALAAYHAEFNGPLTLRLRARPERHLAPYVVDTGMIGADAADAIGLEAAFSAGAFGVAAEAALMEVSAPTADPTYGGYSIEAWWTLTGEFRPYKIDGAVFDRLKPERPISQGGWGAWQVAARYGALDLDDGGLVERELSVGSLGLNWHLEDRVRLMFDLNRSHAETAAGTLDQTGLGIRAQIDF